MISSFPYAHHFEIMEQQMWLLPQKAIYWEDKKMLLLSDLHLGKATHFRKAGVPIPLKVFQKDLDCLSYLVDQIQPSEICFLGDLFHSDLNSEFALMGEWMHKYPALKKELVRGNHDKLPTAYYKKAGIRVYPIVVEKGPFVFAHDPMQSTLSDKYVISGHIHPGVTLRGNGRQSLSLPCFYFGENQALLPAFGEFTGLAMIQPKKKDYVFVIGDGKVHKIGG
jgi:DNA ligase-associated metallophosphoesterase